MKNKITLIVAYAPNKVIGRDNELPWHIPEDLKHFNRTTKNHVVIMGRKTYESLPDKYRPLPQRLNIVITSNAQYESNDAVAYVESLESAIVKAKVLSKYNQFTAFANDDTVFIIGGKSIYDQALPIVDTILASEIKTNYDGNVYFPDIGGHLWSKKILKEYDEFNVVEYVKNIK